MSSSASTTTQIDDPEMGITWFYSVVGIIFFVSFCLTVCVLFFGVQRDMVQDFVIDEKPAFSTNLRLEQKALLGSYGTYSEEVDEQKVERIRIPIDRAMELMAK